MSEVSPMQTSEIYSLEDVHLDELLHHVVECNGTELHLTTGNHPSVRVDGIVREIRAYKKLSAPILERMISDVLLDAQIRQLQNGAKLDFDYTTSDAAERYNAKIFREGATTTATFLILS